MPVPPPISHADGPSDAPSTDKPSTVLIDSRFASRGASPGSAAGSGAGWRDRFALDDRVASGDRSKDIARTAGRRPCSHYDVTVSSYGERRLAAEVRLVGQQQALDDLAADQVFLDDLGDVVGGDVAVPDLLRDTRRR